MATKADTKRVQTVCCVHCVPRISNLYIRCIGNVSLQLDDFSHDEKFIKSQAVGPETPEPPTLCHVQCSATRSTESSWVGLGSRDEFQPRRSQGPCPLLGQNPSHVVSGSEKRKEPQRTTKNPKKNQDHQHDQILTITITIIMKQPKID